MGTTAQEFFPHTTDWDGTDPSGGDVRKAQEAAPANTTGSSVDFGTSGTKSITVDPYTAGRTTTGVASEFGWAINISGTDGMEGTATAKRWIKPGDWDLNCFLIAAPVASLAVVEIVHRVYRVAAAPSTTRTLLLTSDTNSAIVTTAGVNTGADILGAAEVVLEPGETIQVVATLTGTGQAGGLTITYRTGSPDTSYTLPAPGIRTLGEMTGTAAGVGSVSGVGGKILNTVGTASGAASVAGVMGARADTVGTASGSATATGVLGATGAMTGTATGQATVDGVGGKVLGTVGTVEIGAGSVITRRPLLIED